jgi:hypothetical protein
MDADGPDGWIAPRRLRATGAAAMLGLACSTGQAAADGEDAGLRQHADTLLNAVRSRVADCAQTPRPVALAAAGGAPGTRSDTPPEALVRPALSWNPRLAAAAGRHAGAMARTRVFDHVGTDGTTVRERVTATGYRWQAIGENLAAGHPALEDAVAGWLASRSHCEALLDARFTEFGLARAVSNSPSDAYGTYWTLVLGRPR